MADLDDTGTQSGTDPAQSGTGTGTGAENGGTGTGTDDTGSAGASGTKETPPTGQYTEAEMEAVRNRMRAADQRAAQHEAELKQLRDKDLPELEKLNRDFAEVAKERDALKATVNETRLENEFLKNNKFKWKNAAAALKLADLSKVEVHEDGSVTGLTAALDALAKTDSYLLDKSEEDTPEPRGSTGVPGTNGRNAGQTGSNLKGMAARMPALRSRGLG